MWGNLGCWIGAEICWECAKATADYVAVGLLNSFVANDVVAVVAHFEFGVYVKIVDQSVVRDG